MRHLFRICLTCRENGHQDENGVELHSKNSSLKRSRGELKKLMSSRLFIVQSQVTSSLNVKMGVINREEDL